MFNISKDSKEFNTSTGMEVAPAPVDIAKLQILTTLANKNKERSDQPRKNAPPPPSSIRRLNLSQRANQIFLETHLPRNTNFPASPGSPASPEVASTRMNSIISRIATTKSGTNQISPITAIFPTLQEEAQGSGYMTKNKSLKIMKELSIGDLSFGITDEDMVLYHKLNSLKKRKRSVAGIVDLRTGFLQRKMYMTSGGGTLGSGLFDDGGHFEVEGGRELSGMVRDVDETRAIGKRYRREVDVVPKESTNNLSNESKVKLIHNEQFRPPMNANTEGREHMDLQNDRMIIKNAEIQEDITQSVTLVAQTLSIPNNLNFTHRTPPQPPSNPHYERSCQLPISKSIHMPKVKVGATRNQPSIKIQAQDQQETFGMSGFDSRVSQDDNAKDKKKVTMTTNHLSHHQELLDKPRQRSLQECKLYPSTRESISGPSNLQHLNSPNNEKLEKKIGTLLGRNKSLRGLFPSRTGSLRSKFGYVKRRDSTTTLDPFESATDPVALEGESRTSSISKSKSKRGTTSINKNNISGPIRVDVRGNSTAYSWSDTTGIIPIGIHKSSIVSATPLPPTQQQKQQIQEQPPLLQQQQQPVDSMDNSHTSLSSRSYDSQEDEDQQFYYTPQATMTADILSQGNPRPAPLPQNANQQPMLEQIIIPALFSNPTLPQGEPQQQSGGGILANLLKRSGSTLSFKRSRSRLHNANPSTLSIDTTGISNTNISASATPQPSRLVQVANALSSASLLQRQTSPEDLTARTGTPLSIPKECHTIEDTLLADIEQNDFTIAIPASSTAANLKSNDTLEHFERKGNTDTIVTQTLTVPSPNSRVIQQQMKTMASFASSVSRKISQRKMSYVLEDPLAESLHSNRNSVVSSTGDAFDFDNTPKELNFTTFRRKCSTIFPSDLSDDRLRRELKDFHSSPTNIRPTLSAAPPITNNVSKNSEGEFTTQVSALQSSPFYPVNQFNHESKYSAPKESEGNNRQRKNSLIKGYKPRSPTLNPNYRRYSGMSSDLLITGDASSGGAKNPYEGIVSYNPYVQNDEDMDSLCYGYQGYSGSSGMVGSDTEGVPRSEKSSFEKEKEGSQLSRAANERMGSITEEILKEGFYD